MTRSLLSLALVGVLSLVLTPGQASACHKKQCGHKAPTCEVTVVVARPCPPPVVHPCPPPKPPCPPPAPVCERSCAPKAKGCGHLRLFAKHKPCHKCHPAPAPCVVKVACATPVHHVVQGYPLVTAAPQAVVTAAPQVEIVNPAPQAPSK